MDQIDRALLRAAQVNGRGSYAEFGKEVGLSVSAVNNRLRQLESNGMIKGWAAVLDPKKVEFGLLAYIFVQIDLPGNTASFLAGIQKVDEIQECHHVTGDWSYLLKVRARDTDHLETIITDKLKSLKGVVRSHSMIALSSVKETLYLPTE